MRITVVVRASQMLPAVLLVVTILSSLASAKVLNIMEFGAVASSRHANVTNQQAINRALAASKPGDVVLVPAQKRFYSLGGIEGTNLHNITFQIDGDLVASPEFALWPFADSKYAHFIEIRDSSNLIVTGNGYVRGSGLGWWNRKVFPEIYGYLKGQRPKLFLFKRSKNLYVSNIWFMDSPSWNVVFEDIANLEVNNITVTTNRTQNYDEELTREQSFNNFITERKKEDQDRRRNAIPDPGPWPGLQPEDLNTDGIDVAGKDVWIHDSYIQNDDDSIAVKPCNKGCVLSDCTSNVLIENMVLTGFGASIGSVPPNYNINCVANVTFRNVDMPYTGKGVYVKSNPDCDHPNVRGIISNITYQNFTISYPRWWAIWIGPQQMHEPGSPLGKDCPLDYPISSICPTQGCVDFHDIILKDIFIDSPWLSPGVILGNSTNPMTGLVFDNVKVKNPGFIPFEYQYKCEYAEGTSINSDPVPKCFQSEEK